MAQDSKILKSTQVFLSVSVAQVSYGRSKAERTQHKETETVLIHCMTSVLALSTNKSANGSCLLGLSVSNTSGLSYRGESVPKESTNISQN